MFSKIKFYYCYSLKHDLFFCISCRNGLCSCLAQYKRLCSDIVTCLLYRLVHLCTQCVRLTLDQRSSSVKRVLAPEKRRLISPLFLSKGNTRMSTGWIKIQTKTDRYAGMNGTDCWWEAWNWLSSLLHTYIFLNIFSEFPSFTTV